MAQHFLLSAKARNLSLRAIYKDGEEAAYDTFRKMRWRETDGDAKCPRCGGCDVIKTRRKFKCRACHHQFSVTSGTIFASRKMDFVDLLAAICILVNGSKGMSAVQLSRNPRLPVQDGVCAGPQVARGDGTGRPHRRTPRRPR